MMKTRIAMIAGILACTVPGMAADNAGHWTDYKWQARQIHERLRRDGLPTTPAVVEKTLWTIDQRLPQYFPDGPFTREDMIALAWLESGFHQREGGAHGERGLFQIMPDEFQRWHVTKDFYDIDVQTQMALRVLRYKRSKWHDYKLTIHAYNGLVHLRNGKLSEKYWRAFIKRKITVEELLGTNDGRN